MSDDDYDLKQCAKCGGHIPSSATMCSHCGTSAVDGAGGGRGGVVPPALSKHPRLRRLEITKILIWINIGFFIIGLGVQARVSLRSGILPYILGGLDWQAYDLIGWYWDPLVRQGEVWRVLSATFLHGGLLHIAFNMHALKSLGREAEMLFGRSRFLVIYLGSAACSTLAVSWWDSFMGQRPAPLVGASGAVFGVLGVLAVYLYRRGNQRGRAMARSLAINAVLLLGIGWYLEFVSNTAHIGGLVCGGLIGMMTGDSFTSRVDPESERRWSVAAAIFCAAAALALGFALFNAFTAPIPR